MYLFIHTYIHERNWNDYVKFVIEKSTGTIIHFHKHLIRKRIVLQLQKHLCPESRKKRRERNTDIIH